MQGPIDVNDRLPEPLIDVFVFGALDTEDEPEWHMGAVLEDGSWQLTDSEPMPLVNVTHWMPEPPDPRGTAASEPLRAVA